MSDQKFTIRANLNMQHFNNCQHLQLFLMKSEHPVRYSDTQINFYKTKDTLNMTKRQSIEWDLFIYLLFSFIYFY